MSLFPVTKGQESNLGWHLVLIKADTFCTIQCPDRRRELSLIKSLKGEITALNEPSSSLSSDNSTHAYVDTTRSSNISRNILLVIFKKRLLTQTYAIHMTHLNECTIHVR